MAKIRMAHYLVGGNKASPLGRKIDWNVCLSGSIILFFGLVLASFVSAKVSVITAGAKLDPSRVWFSV